MEKWPNGLTVPDSVAGFLSAVGRRDPVFDLNLGTSALLVIDMQKDFILPGAPLEGWNCKAIVPKIVQLVEFFRQHNRPVIWTLHVHQGNDIGLLGPMWPATGPDSPTILFKRGETHAGRKR